MWPADSTYRARFRVPDIVPDQRAGLSDFRARVIFVGESPHKDEVAPLDVQKRVPFSGRAGQAWWRLVGKIVAGEDSTDRSLERVLALAQRGRFFLVNAVSFPVGADIVKHFPNADPVVHLGFTKTGPAAYKRKDQPGVAEALASLKKRLSPYIRKDCQVICLGQDSNWFTEQVVTPSAIIPHPACWWRARRHSEKAEAILKDCLA